jgi:hypothetical protein
MTRVRRVRKPPVDPVLEAVRHSGLFDEAWYRLRYDIPTKVDALADWFVRGCNSGFQPNLCFQPDWYLEQYRDVAAHGVNPLVHYIDNGEAEGRKPSPLFDPTWYR